MRIRAADRCSRPPQDAGLPVTFTLAIGNAGDPIWPDAITMVEKYNSQARGHRHHRPDVPAPNRSGDRPGADRQPVRVLPELPRDRRSAAGRAGRRDAQTRSAGTHPGRQAGSRRPSAAVSGAGVELDLPADRRRPTTSRTARRHRGARGGPRRDPNGGGLRPAARRRRPRHAAGRDGQLREQLAGHRRRTDAPRRRRARPRRRRRTLRNDLRRKLSDVPAGALGARPKGAAGSASPRRSAS